MGGEPPSFVGGDLSSLSCTLPRIGNRSARTGNFQLFGIACLRKDIFLVETCREISMKKIADAFRVGSFAILVLLLPPTPQADAQNTSAAAQSGASAAGDRASRIPAAKPGAKAARPYFIEFRSRSALSYGHTFTVVGRVGSKITAKNVYGLHPFTESSVPWVLGHLVPVPSENGFSDGDIEDEYITARYRVLLTTDEYKKLSAFLEKLKLKSPMWHAALYNCNAYVADIAESLGMRAPFNKWLLPKTFITDLKELNHGVKQLPAPSPPATATAAVQPGSVN